MTNIDTPKPPLRSRSVLRYPGPNKEAVMRGPGKGETIPNRTELLDAMGRCRDALIKAQIGVKPMGVMYSACSMVMAGMPERHADVLIVEIEEAR